MEIHRLWMMFGVFLLSIDGHSGSTIVGCEQGKVDVQEGTNHSFTCDQCRCKRFRVYDSNRYTLCPYNYTPCWSCGLVLYFGVLEYSYSCFCDPYPNVISRDSVRMIIFDCYSQEDNCTLNLVATPVHKNGSCGLSISNWKVTGSCNVTGMYSSENNYTCKWRVKNNTNEEFGEWNVLEGYNATNKRFYKRGVCSFTRPIPFLNGSYTYIMRVSPGSDAYYNNTIVIDPPDKVQLNHSCPSYVLEGSSVSCTCNASTMGSPPGLVAWYEMTNATLLLTNVSKNTSGRQFTCRLEWGSNGAIKAITSYILTVAYGPSDVIINRIAETRDDKSGIIRFTCSAIYFYPSVVFQWNTTCENQTDYSYFSLCNINITQRAGDLVIECTATNTYFPKTFFSRVYIFPVEERRQEIKDSSAECVNTIIVGGVGAAVIALIIIAAVLPVCITKRQRGMAERKETPLPHLHSIFKRPKSQILTDRQGDINSIACTTSADHGVDNAAVYETVQSSVTRYVTYDNRIVTQEIGGRTTALKPLTKPMPTTTGKQNCQGLSDSVYETGSMRTDIEHDYEDFSPKGFKASQSSDTSRIKVTRYNEDENQYENVTN